MKQKLLIGLLTILALTGIKSTVDAALLSPFTPPSSGVRFIPPVHTGVHHPKMTRPHQSLEQQLRAEFELLAQIGSQA
jgi:hypothetical protein